MKKEALIEFRKMWTWLYRHPAHDRKYYIKHVAMPENGWEKDCPLCAFSESQSCTECLEMWDQGNGTLLEDPQSPFNKWKNTHLSDPNNRTWYAGKLVDIADKCLVCQ